MQFVDWMERVGGVWSSLIILRVVVVVVVVVEAVIVDVAEVRT